ncbi:MAG: hypothetical protein QGF46_07720, partial [Planctomycetota bacterium]|nr:hypothetical protein [Planctomycetota bacterium]
GAIEPERGEIEHNTFGAELGFLFNTKPNRSHELAFELWADDRQFREAANSYPYSLSRGEWAMYQFVYDSNWSLGAIGSRCDVLGLTVIDDDASHHSAFVSYQPSFGGNVSMFGTHTNPGSGQEKYFTFGMAYSLNLGRSPMPLGQRWY